MLSDKELNLIRKYNIDLMNVNKEVCDFVGEKYNYTETLFTDSVYCLTFEEIISVLKDIGIDKDLFETIFHILFRGCENILNDIEKWENNHYDKEVLSKMKQWNIVYEKGILVCDPFLENLSNYDLLSEIIEHKFENLIFYDVDFVGFQFENGYHIEIERQDVDYDLKVVKDNKPISIDVDLNQILNDNSRLTIGEDVLELIGVSVY